MRAVRAAAPSSSLTAAAVEASVVAPVPAEQWGERMAALVASSPSLAPASAAEGAGGSRAEQLRQLQSYLKRVAWIGKQRKASYAPTASIDISVTAPPRWTRLSEAERVRWEMEHTMEQRKRFRRERRGGGREDGDE